MLGLVALVVLGIESEKLFKCVLVLSYGYGKSPCFLRCSVFALVDVDSARLDFVVVDVKEILE